MENVIIIAVVAAVLTLAITYIIKAKKRGQKCIGCNGNCQQCKK